LLFFLLLWLSALLSFAKPPKQKPHPIFCRVLAFCLQVESLLYFKHHLQTSLFTNVCQVTDWWSPKATGTWQ
jgi:hypothetical protein